MDLNEVELIDSEAARSESLRELRALQQELRELIQQRKMFKKATSSEAKDRIIELLLQIQKIQERKCIPSSLPPGQGGAKSMQYLATFAVDLAQLITIAHEKVDLPRESLRNMLALAEPDEDRPLVKIAHELFRNFVAYERGTTRSAVLGVVKDRIWTLMDQEEQSELFSRILREFLAGPRSGFSQKSVIDALDALSIPAGDLIHFLSEAVGLGSERTHPGSKGKESLDLERPVVMVSSILVLSLRQL